MSLALRAHQDESDRLGREDHKDFLDMPARKAIAARSDHLDFPDSLVKWSSRGRPEAVHLVR